MILIILLIGITTYTSQKSILRSYWVKDGYCQTDLNRYYFYIYAELRGNLTQSMFENYTINVKSNYSVEVKCDFPEIYYNSSQIIIINCYTDIIEDIKFPFSFEGTSNELELINFNENYLYLKIHCLQNITLILGEIKDRDKKYNSDPNVVYKITILNETLPNDLNLKNIDLQPIIIDNNNNYYKNSYTYCHLVNNDYNNYFECTMDPSGIEAKFFYPYNYTYETKTDNYSIMIKNINEDLIITQYYLTLILGEISGQGCHIHDSYSNIFYTITILNETLPNNLYLHDINLKPIIINNNIDYGNYYTSCNLVNYDYHYYFECTIEPSGAEGEFIYPTNYVYETLINDYSIKIKNINEELVFGKMLKCSTEYKINYNNITLILGEIKDQECRKYDSYSNYVYKITILNETLPNDIYLHDINLQPNTFSNKIDYKNYYTSCNLVNNDYNNYFECTMQSSRIFDETIYYETNYTYKDLSNYYYPIIIKNINEDLYIGKNIICYNEPKVNYLDN